MKKKKKKEKKKKKKHRATGVAVPRVQNQFLKRFLSVFSHHTDYVFVREKHDVKTVQILAGVFIACTIRLSNEQSNAKSAVTYMTRV